LAAAQQAMMPHPLFVTTFVPGAESYDDEWGYGASYALEYLTELIREQSLQCQSIEWAYPNSPQRLLLRIQEGP
jgi:hypothetical protein